MNKQSHYDKIDEKEQPFKPRNYIKSTAGAVPIRNDKGEVVMEKVKVQRYVTGKRPDWATRDSSDESSEDELDTPFQRPGGNVRGEIQTSASAVSTELSSDKQDRRLQRLMEAKQADEDQDSDEEFEDRLQRHRRIMGPEIVHAQSDDEEDRHRGGVGMDDEEDDDDVELEEEEIERRRMMLRQRALQNRARQGDGDAEAGGSALAGGGDEMEEESEDESEEESEYESEYESEEESGPRLKPVFVRKRDRVTLLEREKQEEKEKEMEEEKKRMTDIRRRETLKIIEQDNKKELEKDMDIDDKLMYSINTDDENDEAEYEGWKIRELKRIKKQREERDQVDKDKEEIDRVRNMTEEERRAEFRANPKKITNKAQKGKYKFLQKYYHRGAFYLDEDSEVYQRDFSNPTLEDHFDKTILPKVMQVKNFGRSGRTKYTHLVDQDTTSFDSPWTAESVSTVKFHAMHAGGSKQTFERPAVKGDKKT